MDLQTPQVPGIEFVFAGNQEEQSPSTSGKRKKTPSVVDEILSIPTSNKKPLEQLCKSKSSSSADESLGSFREVSNAASGIIDQLQETIKTFQDYKEERSTLDIQNKKDHIEILEHIQTFRKDLGDYKKRIEHIEALYKILNDGLSAAQQSEALRNKKILEVENKSQQAKEQLAETLQKINTNADIYMSVQQQYNELKTQFDELCTTLAQNQTASPLLNKIMSTPRLNSEKMGEGAIGEASQTSETTLEDMLTQQQEELLEVRKLIQLIQQLHVTSTKNQSDFHNVIDDLHAQIATAEQRAVAAQNKAVAVESRNETIIRRAFFFTTGTFAVLASFWIWWQTHKA